MNVHIISDIGIRNKLISYYQYLEQVRIVETVHDNYITSYVLPFVMKKMDMTGGKLPEDFNLNGMEFRNLTAGYYVVEKQKMEMK